MPVLVHDYLLLMRGAERSFAAIASCWPDAPICTLLYDAPGTRGAFEGRELHVSYLQRLRPGPAGFRRLLPLYPRAVERLPVGGHDLVISSSSAFAHGVRPDKGSTHICYCYTPFRYAWHERSLALQEAPRYAAPLLGRMLDRARAWDLEASRRVTHYIAISEIARERIADCYGRESTVVYPPVEIERFSAGEPEDFMLVVTEVVRHKRVEVALDAARRAGMKIKVVGGGPDLERLKATENSSVEFLGRVTDSELADLYARSRALVLPNVEEFGIAAVEAQAAGRPVVAAAAGGALETVVDGETGVLVPPGDVEALAEALRYTDFARFRPERSQENARRFSTEAFRERFAAEVARLSGTSQHRA